MAQDPLEVAAPLTLDGGNRGLALHKRSGNGVAPPLPHHDHSSVFRSTPLEAAEEGEGHLDRAARVVALGQFYARSIGVNMQIPIRMLSAPSAMPAIALPRLGRSPRYATMPTPIA